VSVKSKISKSIALLLSAIVLIGAFGVSADFHICQDQVKSIGIFASADICESMTNDKVCESPKEQSSYTKKKCCSNVSIFEHGTFESNNLAELQLHNVQFDSKQSISLQIYKASNLEEQYKHYRPPERQFAAPIIILHQSFLI